MKNRILFHHRTRGFGAEKSHILGVVESFERRGYTVDLISPPGIDFYRNSTTGICENSDNIPFLKKIFYSIYDYLPDFLFGIMELLYNIYSFVFIIFKINKTNYDFIYDRYSIKTFSTVLISKLYRLPIILEVNDSTFIVRSRKLTFKTISKKIEKYVFNNSNIIITISTEFKRMISSEVCVDPKKILVLSNAINPEKFILEKNNIIDSGLFFSKKNMIFGCVGAFVPWHGLDLLIEWTYDILQTTSIAFLFIGDGPVRESVEALARQYGIDDKIRFTGFVDSEKVPYYLDVLDVCVIPDSNSHGSPMKLFEFMAMGKPSIVPAYEPLLEVVTDGEEVLFFKPQMKESFREAFLKLASSSDLRSYLGAQSKKNVDTNYTWDINFEKLNNKLIDEGLI